ncbi:hypothetical protein [Sunxiuqinia sp. sy24]|uniref:hypothetical protein n=1 Tax=Sunxiuqinia sp. sy24 TaxID=3461495 RepID=UPI004045F62C
MEEKITCSTANATLLACTKIAQSFSENIYELSLIRSDWTQEYSEELRSRIKSAKDKYLPADNYYKHAEKQQHVHELMISSLRKVALLRALIKVDFKDDKKFQKRIFEELGYNDYFSEAKNGDYQSLYHLLKVVHESLTPELKQALTSKSIPTSLVDKILEFDDQLREFNSCFDLLVASEQLSDEGKRIVNNIFSEVQDICRITTAYYLFEPLKRDQFCFFRVMFGLKETVPQTH